MLCSKRFPKKGENLAKATELADGTHMAAVPKKRCVSQKEGTEDYKAVASKKDRYT